MTDREIEMKLRSAIDNTAPDGLSRLLSDVKILKGDREMKNANAKRNPRWLGIVAACLVVTLIAGFGGFYYGQNYAVATTVSLDVNPSIELKVNRSEKVIKCTGLNDEGRDILSSMNGGADLEGSKLNVAVNAIVGAIVKAGYLDSLSSAILISVEDKDAVRGERLQAQLVAEVDGVLKTASNSAGVLSQYVTVDAGVDKQAQQNNISSGKAAYINQVVALNPALDFAALAELSVEELRDLIKIGAPAMPIGRAQAVLAASEYAGVLELDSVVPDVDPELDDLVPHYEVELTWGSHINHYEYTVDAFTGEVLSGLKDAVSAADQSAPGVTADEAFDQAAEYFHAKHPELGGYNIFDIYTEYDRDGHYDVSFWCNGYDFEYEVDGQTGQVLHEETHYRQNTSNGTGSAGTTPSEITLDDAKAAALNHAALTASQVTWEKTEKDTDNGKSVYEIDFYTDDTEYDYEIDAATGNVIKSEKEARPGTGNAGTGTGSSGTGAGTGTGGNTTTPAQPTDIGVDAAKAAALKHAGLAESQVTFEKAEKDYDNGKSEYEIDFYTADFEYDYEIDAATGNVIKSEKEARPGTGTGAGNSGTGTGTGTSGSTTTPAQSTDIGVDAAKAAALKHAGLAESQVTFEKAEKDYDNGKLEYEIDFYTADTEYDYEIDAANGNIIKSEKEARPGTGTGTGTGNSGTGTGTGTGTGGNTTTPTQPADIGADAAKAAALDRAGVSAADATWIKCEHDWDDGHHHYELEFECGSTVYECEINAADGTILSFGSEPCDNLAHHHEDSSHQEEHHDDGHHSGTSTTTDIGADAARAAALAHAGLTESQVTRLECERDYDDGRLEYEVSFKSDGWEYEYKIDAATGSVLEHERDRDD